MGQIWGIITIFLRFGVWRGLTPTRSVPSTTNQLVACAVELRKQRVGRHHLDVASSSTVSCTSSICELHVDGAPRRGNVQQSDSQPELAGRQPHRLRLTQARLGRSSTRLPHAHTFPCHDCSQVVTCAAFALSVSRCRESGEPPWPLFVERPCC